MYQPRQGRRRDQNVHRREPNRYLNAALPALTVVIWASALAFVGFIVLYSVLRSRLRVQFHRGVPLPAGTLLRTIAGVVRSAREPVVEVWDGAHDRG